MLGKKCKIDKGKRAVKKITAAVLAATVLCTTVSMGNPKKIEAVSSVSMTTSKRLKTGQSYVLKLKSAARWIVQSAKTENKKIVKIVRQSKKAVTVSAVRTGWCNVMVKAKNSGNGKTKKFKCRIQVTSGVKREVSTQAQLNAALKKKDMGQITINNTTQETSYQIPAGTYSNVALIVKAGGAKVTNNGTFGSVTIQSAKKGGGWTENAKGNSLRVTSTVSKIVVNKGAKVANLSLEKAGMDTQLEIKGRVSKVTVNGANTKLAISGSTASVVPITINKAASGAEITASVRVKATVKAKKVQITLNKGAEESTIKAIKVRTGVVNSADGDVMVTDGNGTFALDPGMEITTVVSSSNVDYDVSSTEGKNEGEVEILQSIIKGQNAKGAIIPKNLNDERYTWENGHVMSVDWSSCGLTGKLEVNGLKFLQEMKCDHNYGLTELTVSNLSNLRMLSCCECYDGVFFGPLMSLDLSGLTSLETLRCDINGLTNLNVSGLTSLRLLSCSYNRLMNLDVSGLTSLGYLECGNNQLTNLDVSGLISLEYLYCKNNQFTKMDVSGLTNLKSLQCDDNVKVIGRP